MGLEDGCTAQREARARLRSHPKRGAEGCGLEAACGVPVAALDNKMG